MDTPDLMDTPDQPSADPLLVAPVRAAVDQLMPPGVATVTLDRAELSTVLAEVVAQVVRVTIDTLEADGRLAQADQLLEGTDDVECRLDRDGFDARRRGGADE